MTYKNYKEKRIEKIIKSFDKFHYTNKREIAEGVFNGDTYGYVKGGYKEDYKQKMLIAEDLAHFANFLEMIYEKDYDVQIASDEDSALEKIANQEFDIAIIDGCLDGESYQTGTNVSKAASKKGIYTIGLSSTPSSFYKHAKDYLAINYQKMPDREVLRYIIENKPNKEEWNKYVIDNDVYIRDF